MTWRAFLYAADALRIEEGVGFHVETAPGLSVPMVPSTADVKQQNAQAMQNLQALMAGVQGRKR